MEPPGLMSTKSYSPGWNGKTRSAVAVSSESVKTIVAPVRSAPSWSRGSRAGGTARINEAMEEASSSRVSAGVASNGIGASGSNCSAERAASRITGSDHRRAANSSAGSTPSFVRSPRLRPTSRTRSSRSCSDAAAISLIRSAVSVQKTPRMRGHFSRIAATRARAKEARRVWTYIG